MDTAFWEGLEEALIAADVGVAASTEVVKRVRDDEPADTAEARRALRTELIELLDRNGRDLSLDGLPAVVIVVGVNGTGKTTSIAKLAGHLKSIGLEPLLGAADTFRAAADQQLRTWADRVGVEVVGGQAGADPASVAFDAYQAARARGRDVVIVDTAGRLHSKTNLMDELGKVVRVVAREAGRIDEVLLVLDATTGQNGIAQVRQFTEAVGVTGIVLTKLDGTARGGVAIAVERELGVPVKFIGIGEGLADLIPFEPEAFIDALLEDE
jgi:fused signal recognition particle receptor